MATSDVKYKQNASMCMGHPRFVAGGRSIGLIPLSIGAQRRNAREKERPIESTNDVSVRMVTAILC